jgi:hypothetical protein
MRIGARHHGFAGFYRLAQTVQYPALEFPVLGSKLPKARNPTLCNH